MDFAQIQLFRDIVQSRSISRGAAMNGVTQSAASQALQELERQLGARLLDRSHRPLEVLPAGRLFYDSRATYCGGSRSSRRSWRS